MTGVGKAADASKDQGPTTGQTSTNSLLTNIAANTKETAKNTATQLQNQILGGGALAKYGVNRQELADLNSASQGSGRLNHVIETFGSAMAKIIYDEIARSGGFKRREV
jgi:hypothetical protein